MCGRLFSLVVLIEKGCRSSSRRTQSCKKGPEDMKAFEIERCCKKTRFDIPRRCRRARNRVGKDSERHVPDIISSVV